MTWRLRRRRDDTERQLDAELRDHLERLTADHIECGMTPSEARRMAQLAFGGLDQVKESCRDVRRCGSLDDAAKDVRYAIRGFCRTPGFTVAAIFTLALGIGATTALFSVVQATLLQPLPYADADRLVRVAEHVPRDESPSGVAVRTMTMTQDAFLWWRDHTQTLSDLAASLTVSVTAPIGTETVRFTGARVSPSFFTMLGVPPIVGRGLTADDVHPNEVLLSAATWGRVFGRDRAVVGRTLVLDDVAYTIVGVLPADVALPSAQTELWMPYVGAPDGPQRILTVDVLGRLQRGVSIAAASVEANMIGNAFLGLPGPGAARAPNPPRFEVVSLHDHLVEPIRPALRVLMASVGLVLLLVCANVANLLLARGSTRQRELGIRRALGAGRGRLMRQLLTEGVVLATAGGVAGLMVAFLGLRLLPRLTTIHLPALYGGDHALLPGIDRAHLDVGVLTVTLLVCLGTGLLCGVLPALQLSRVPLHSTWGQVAIARATRTGRHLRRLLSVTQLALATMLLICAGLLLRSVVNLSTVDLGYRPTDAVTFELVVPQNMPGSRKLALANALTTRLAAWPRVVAAGFTGAAPLSTVSGGYVVTPSGRATAQTLSSRPLRQPRASVVSPNYLRAIGARLVAGRWLDADDGQVPPRAILINRTLARQFFGDASPLGHSVDIGGVPWPVVGVVSDIRARGVDVDPDPQAYVDPARLDAAARAVGWRELDAAPLFVSFAVRVTGGPTRIAADVRALTHQLDPLATVDGLVAMDQVVSSTLTAPRVYALLLSLFAGVAAVLAAIGIYGVLSYAISVRTQELGIRMALGAAPAHVRGLIVREGIVLTVVGVLLGVAGAVGLTRALHGLLFGLTPLDPPTYVVVGVAFAAVATVASYLPARRATRIQPLVALRTES